jgi:hypothetical protein
MGGLGNQLASSTEAIRITTTARRLARSKAPLLATSVVPVQAVEDGRQGKFDAALQGMHTALGHTALGTSLYAVSSWIFCGPARELARVGSEQWTSAARSFKVCLRLLQLLEDHAAAPTNVRYMPTHLLTEFFSL